MRTDERRDVDVLVIGGATAGLYFAGLMARQGFKVLVCDRSSREELGASFDIIHIAKEHFAEFGLREPGPGDKAYVSAFRHSIMRSALNNWPKDSFGNTLVLRRVPLISDLADWACEQGVELMLETGFKRPLFDADGRLAGAVLARTDGSGSGSGDSGGGTGDANASSGSDAADPRSADPRSADTNTASTTNADEFSVFARLTADASGIPAVVRTALPDDYGADNFICGPREQFYVVLHYADLSFPERDHVDTTTTWTHYKIWLAPQHGSGGAIMGVGANLSFDYAERCFQRFAAKGFLPPYTLNHLEQGSTPYCRIPHSLVADSFVALGSAACISNPWSGEGVPYGWLECRIAAEECGRAMASGALPTREGLWAINVRYAQEQGALFAKNLAMLVGATRCSEAENDYEFKQGIIYENHDEQGNSTERGSMVFKLLKGLFTGNISLGTLRGLLASSSLGEKVEKHYLAYPSAPDGLSAWAQAADALWTQAGSMADVAEADLAMMLAVAVPPIAAPAAPPGTVSPSAAASPATTASSDTQKEA